MNRIRVTIILLALLFGAVWGPPRGEAERSSDLYFIDAHSQISEDVVLETVIRRMDDNGVHRTILSANAKRDTASVAAFARRHPERVIAAVRTKGGDYRKDESGYYLYLEEQATDKSYGAMAEVMLWHTPKRNREGHLTGQSKNYYNVLPSDPRVREAVKAAIARGWPIILHIESGALERKEGEKRRALFWKEIERLLDKHPRYPFVINKLAQLSPAEVRRLIGVHPNIHFLTDHSTNPRQRPWPENWFAEPWVNIFKNEREFSPEWAALLTRHPERFIFALDMVRDKHWRKKKYKKAVRYFSRALSRLPAAARAIAHGNAERLWRLAPR
jgi:predicted TIM-barrel fold metal-dependent hydrolase